MKSKYVMNLAFLLSFACCHGQNDTIQAKLDSLKKGIIEKDTNQTILFDTLPLKHCDTTNIPLSFIIRIPVRILDNIYFLNLELSKMEHYPYATAKPKNKIDPHFPRSFYEVLINTLDDRPSSFVYNYYEAYQSFKADNFVGNDWVGYKKETGVYGTSNLITVVDINNDNVPEIILEDAENSSRGNPCYKLYRWDTKKQKCISVPVFFDGAFYGWDKTLKYMITGYQDLDRKAHRIKNKVIGYKLVPVKKWTEEY